MNRKKLVMMALVTAIAVLPAACKKGGGEGGGQGGGDGSGKGKQPVAAPAQSTQPPKQMTLTPEEIEKRRAEFKAKAEARRAERQAERDQQLKDIIAAQRASLAKGKQDGSLSSADAATLSANIEKADALIKKAGEDGRVDGREMREIYKTLGVEDPRIAERKKKREERMAQRAAAEQQGTAAPAPATATSAPAPATQPAAEMPADEADEEPTE